eukprot:scaffold11868_cov277-Chaetoceros_neogracile.AAC.3
MNRVTATTRVYPIEDIDISHFITFNSHKIARWKRMLLKDRSWFCVAATNRPQDDDDDDDDVSCPNHNTQYIILLNNQRPGQISKPDLFKILH